MLKHKDEEDGFVSIDKVPTGNAGRSKKPTAKERSIGGGSKATTT